MNANISAGPLRPEVSIDAVIADHGATKVLVRAALALLRGKLRKSRPPDLSRLDDYLRKDIGVAADATGIPTNDAIMHMLVWGGR